MVVRKKKQTSTCPLSPLWRLLLNLSARRSCLCLGWHLLGQFINRKRNRPFPSSLVPLFQNESKCETILMKMTLICTKMKLHAELILIWKASHLDSFWNRGTRELRNGLLSQASYMLEVKFESSMAFKVICLSPETILKTMTPELSKMLWQA